MDKKNPPLPEISAALEKGASRVLFHPDGSLSRTAIRDRDPVDSLLFLDTDSCRYENRVFKRSVRNTALDFGNKQPDFGDILIDWSGRFIVRYRSPVNGRVNGFTENT
jgi:hypothetical protein